MVGVGQNYCFSTKPHCSECPVGQSGLCLKVGVVERESLVKSKVKPESKSAQRATLQKSAPPNWDRVYYIIRKHRATHPAPVDELVSEIPSEMGEESRVSYRRFSFFFFSLLPFSDLGEFNSIDDTVFLYYIIFLC